ncbi:LLM class flavin-dependent oxidoreductase [Sorangium sp. So ce327]|uniref:LLM class flavin-dependent oxidoreductase n=1 Tax=Sorangium sp. So ce327 TaxID=3133301 RepID=UPI003F619A4D
MSAQRERRLLLGAYLSYGTGHHPAAWRLPGTPADGAQSPAHYVRLAQTAERGRFDFMFLSDTPSVFQDDREGYGARVAVFEPLTLLSALAMHTQHLGLVATASTTYEHPYKLAREFASLDHLSGGRAGWNVVTSSKAIAAHNFGFAAHPDHAERYRRAEEAFQVVTGLWDSWDDDALPRDKASGVFYRPDRCHPIHHEGEFYRVRGPLNISRSPQGYPLLVQAGSSDAGRDLAARTAEVVFTAQPESAPAVEFRRDLLERAARYQRLNPHIYVMPGLCPFIGKTDEEAQAKLRTLNSLVHPRFAVQMLSDLVGGFDLSGCDLDKPMPPLPPSNGNRSRRELIERISDGGRRSLREVCDKMIIARGHCVFVGSYRSVAEQIAAWFEAGACDGFNIMPPSLPGCLDEFVDGVVPELQRLGLVQREYRPGTLRDKLGLRRPVPRR